MQSFVVRGQENIIKTESGRDVKAWNIVHPGFFWYGVCKNKKCAAVDSLVAGVQGMVQNFDVFGKLEECRCRECRGRFCPDGYAVCCCYYVERPGRLPLFAVAENFDLASKVQGTLSFKLDAVAKKYRHIRITTWPIETPRAG